MSLCKITPRSTFVSPSVVAAPAGVPAVSAASWTRDARLGGEFGTFLVDPYRRR